MNVCRLPTVPLYCVFSAGASQGCKDRYYLGPDGKVMRSRAEAVAKAAEMAKFQLLVDAAEEALLGRVSCFSPRSLPVHLVIEVQSTGIDDCWQRHDIMCGSLCYCHGAAAEGSLPALLLL